MQFSSEIVEEIKSYVYLYSDSDTEEVFYIGKGQKNRCFEHLQEESESTKTQKIQELKEQNKQPLIELLRYGLTEKEASLIEASLIDFIGIEKITNKFRGANSNSFGRMSVEDIAVKYTAEKVNIDDDVILITINKLYRSKMSEKELYESTRGCWVVGDRKTKAQYAFAVFQGIVKEIYKINKWHKAGTLAYEYRKIDTYHGTRRWEFEGIKADELIRKKYLKKSIRQYLSKGTQNPIKYVNC